MANQQIAQGMAAEKAGNLVEAIFLYQKAEKNKAGITEAAARMKSTTANMVSGGIGADVAKVAYNEIEQLNREADQWIKIWTDYWKMFQNASILEVYFDESLPKPTRELGSTTIQYNNYKYSLYINMEEVDEVYNTIKKAYNSVDKERRDWYLTKAENAAQLNNLMNSNYCAKTYSNKAWFEISIVNKNKKKAMSYKREVEIVKVGEGVYGLKMNTDRSLSYSKRSRHDHSELEWSKIEYDSTKNKFAVWLWARSNDFWAAGEENFKGKDKYDYVGYNKFSPFSTYFSYDYNYRYYLQKKVKTSEIVLYDDFNVHVDDYTEPLTLRVEAHNGICKSYRQKKIDDEVAKKAAEEAKEAAKKAAEEAERQRREAARQREEAEFHQKREERKAKAQKYLIEMAAEKGPLTKGVMDKYARITANWLGDLIIPEGFTSIDKDVFKDCTSLESVTIPNSVTLIGHWAFRDCTSLKSAVFENPKDWLKFSDWDAKKDKPKKKSKLKPEEDLSNPAIAAKLLTEYGFVKK